MIAEFISPNDAAQIKYRIKNAFYIIGVEYPFQKLEIQFCI